MLNIKSNLKNRKITEALQKTVTGTDPMFTTSTYKQLGRNDTNDRLK